MKRIPVFFSADRNYLPCLSVAIASLAATASEEYLYDLRVLSGELASCDLEGLISEPRSNIRLSVVNPEKYLLPLRERLTRRLRDYYSEAIFYRIFIPSLYPELSRAVYLDCDIVLTADVAELYFTDLRGTVLGAVPDESVALTPAFSDYVRGWVGTPPEEYFNSGVLVMDLDAMRRERVEERFIEHLNAYDPETVAPDQDYLNYLLRGSVCLLDGGWNTQPCHLGEDTPRLVHFNFHTKPWHYRGVKYEEIFWKYAEDSPYRDRLLAELEGYGEREREIDLAGGERLLSEAARLAVCGGSFANPVGRA